jgi:hypothetical protein
MVFKISFVQQEASAASTSQKISDLFSSQRTNCYDTDILLQDMSREIETEWIGILLLNMSLSGRGASWGFSNFPVRL